MQIATTLRDRKDHFVATLYEPERKKLGITIGDILIIRVEEKELVRVVKEDFNISLPKEYLKQKRHQDTITLEIVRKTKPKSGLKRPATMIQHGKLDIRHFIRQKTTLGHPLYVIGRDPEHSLIWYPVGGGVRPLILKNHVDIEKIAELLGFYFGDGSTSKGIRSFRLTNAESSTLCYCMGILQEMGIPRDAWKAQIIYTTNREITEHRKSNIIRFWSSALGIDADKIISIGKTNGLSESLEFGSARIFIDNATMVEIFLHGMLKGVIRRILRPCDAVDMRLLRGFIRGLLAAEGSVQLNKSGSVVRVGISFDPHSDELQLYKCLLTNAGISYGLPHGNELLIYGAENLRKLCAMDAFRMHLSRKTKFLCGAKRHQRINLSEGIYPALSSPFHAPSGAVQGTH